MIGSLRFPQLTDSEESRLAGFDNMVASMKPAITARNSLHEAVPSQFPSSSKEVTSFPSAKSFGDPHSSISLRLANKDREITALRRQVQDVMSSCHRLERELLARNTKINALEKKCEISTQKQTELGTQLQTVRAELERSRHRALTDHRKQEQRIVTLEQAISRKLGMGQMGTYSFRELLVNPLKGEPSNGQYSPTHVTVIKSAFDAQQTVEAKIDQSLKLEKLCEALERNFDLNGTSTIPRNIIHRLEIDVESAIELLNFMVQRFEVLGLDEVDMENPADLTEEESPFTDNRGPNTDDVDYYNNADEQQQQQQQLSRMAAEPGSVPESMLDFY